MSDKLKVELMSEWKTSVRNWIQIDFFYGTNRWPLSFFFLLPKSARWSNICGIDWITRILWGWIIWVTSSRSRARYEIWLCDYWRVTHVNDLHGVLGLIGPSTWDFLGVSRLYLIRMRQYTLVLSCKYAHYNLYCTGPKRKYDDAN